MGVVAEATIKLVNVNDGYSLSISPESITITADVDGSNAVLTNALTYIRLYRGEDLMLSTITNVEAITGDTDDESGIESVTDTTLTACDEDGNADSSVVIRGDDNRGYAPCWQLKLEEISEELTSGGVTFTVTCEDEYEIEGRFTYTVVRENTLLDWIKDWDDNKTYLSEVAVITPKIFVGQKIDEDNEEATTLLELESLSGVYIGPAEQVYGSDADDDLSGVYGIYEGEVTFKIDGEGGYIAGWTIESDSLWSAHIELYQGEDNKYIAVSKSEVAKKGVMDETISGDSGSMMYYTSDTEYGFKTYSNSVSVFSAGSENYIGPWNFDEDALWYGTKKNTAGEYTSKSGYVTMGTEGIRGYKWYLDTDGTCSFVGGIVSFTASEGKIGGWTIADDGLWSEHAMLYVSDTTSGFAFCPSEDLSTSSTLASAVSKIRSNGGVYLQANSSSENTEFTAYNNDGDVLFRVTGVEGTTSTSKISGWYFSADSLYISDDGDEPTPDETTGFVEDGELLLTTDGLYGSSWALYANGCGTMSQGNVYWNEDGVFHMKVCEVSGFIRTEPRIIAGEDSDYSTTTSSQRMLNLDASNLYEGGFIYVAETDDSDTQDGIRLPMLLKYAGAQITVCVKDKTRDFYVRCTVSEDYICEQDTDDYTTASDGSTYADWNYDGDEVYGENSDGENIWMRSSTTSGSTSYSNTTTDGTLLGIRCGDTTVSYVRFAASNTSTTNKMLLLLAVPYHQDVYDEDEGAWYRGMVEWQIINSEQYDVQTSSGIRYAVYVG